MEHGMEFKTGGRSQGKSRLMELAAQQALDEGKRVVIATPYGCGSAETAKDITPATLQKPDNA